MKELKPGGLRIVEQAVKEWRLPRGSKILDIGCGRGETLEYLEREYGYEGHGIDLSLERIREGKARYPNLNLKYGDGEFLDEYPSYSFDGVLMECTLSLIRLPDEALHEVFCVLKKGGRLLISDLYLKHPDAAFLKALAIEAERQRKMPHSTGECDAECEEEHKTRAVSFRSDGRFLIDPLMELMDEIGFYNLKWIDCSADLDQFVAQKLMDDGTLDGCLCGEALHPKDSFQTGYFMLTAEKPLK